MEDSNVKDSESQPSEGEERQEGREGKMRQKKSSKMEVNSYIKLQYVNQLKLQWKLSILYLFMYELSENWQPSSQDHWAMVQP